MILQDFAYYKPATVKEVVNLLRRYGTGFKILAGGTDLIPSLKEGIISPEAIIDLKGLGLNLIRDANHGGLVIEALATLDSLEKSRKVKELYPALWDAVTHMATAQVRNRATVGGNLCYASPSADTAPPLIVYGASATAESAAGRRNIPVEELFAGPGQTTLQPGEIITAITLPEVPANSGSAYIKHCRTEKDLAILGVAVYLELDGGRICRAARLALGAVAPVPIRTREAEANLEGKEITGEIIVAAADLASREASPIDDQRASAEYRRDMVREVTMRALRKALEKAEKRRPRH